MAILKNLIVNGVTRVIGDLTASKIIKQGGVSSLFLKADGSVDSTSYYHSGNKPSLSDLGAASSSHTHSYLPLTGGTLTGSLEIKSASSGNYNEGLRISAAANNWAGITFGSTGLSGAPTNGWFAALNPSDQFIISPNDSSNTTGLTLNAGGDAKWRNNKIWHAGNDGSGSGLDADLLDGNHASAFATSSHNHDSTYVAIVGTQTITGKKTFSSGLAITSGSENKKMPYFLGIDAYADGGSVKYIRKEDVVSCIGAAAAGHNHDSTYVKYAKVSKSTADSTNANPYIYNVENETVVSGYYAYWYILNFGKYSGGNYVTQLAMPYQNSLTDSELFIRSAKESTWRTWRRVLHSNNYTEYTVKKDGTGASGTWGINISGNADTVDSQHFSYSNDSNSPTYLWATNSNGYSFLAARGSISVNYANSAGYSQKLQVHDVRGEVRNPNYFDDYKITSWFNNAGTPSSNWYSGIHVKGWHDEYTSWELCSYSSTGTTNDYDLYFRSGNNTTWGSWKTILDSFNYSSFALPLSGGTITGTLTINRDASAIHYNNQSGVSQGWLGFSAADTPSVWMADGSTRYNIIHSGNIGSQSVNYATSAGSSNTATIAGSLGDNDTINMYAQYSNEINFGGGNSSSTIYFGYRATDSRPIPTEFIFGNTTGTANLKASKFIKTGSSDSYVLLGAGGHKAISDFSMAHEHPYLPLSGGTITGDLYINNNLYGPAIGNNPRNRYDSGLYFFNCNSSTISTYNFGLYQWNDEFQFTYRTSADNVFQGNAFTIQGSNGQVTFTNIPKVGSTLVSLVGHTHTTSEITGFPSSLPANGGTSSYVTVSTNYSSSSRNILFHDLNAIYSNTYLTVTPSTGNVTSSGHFYANSDIRYKNIIEYHYSLSNKIAQLPIIKYKWIDRDDDSLHIGSSALSVMSIIPELVSYDNNTDFYSLDYATLGAVAGISACKEVEILKLKIKELELEIIILKSKYNG